MCKQFPYFVAIVVASFVTPPPCPAADDKGEEAKTAVGKLQQGLVEAFGKGAKALGEYLEPILSDDAVITDTGGNVHDKARFLAMAKGGDRGATAMEQKEGKVRVYGDTAVVTGLISTTTRPAEAFRTTVVYVRAKNQWRIVTFHATAVSRP